jgi:predicted metal-binding membrane protein
VCACVRVCVCVCVCVFLSVSMFVSGLDNNLWIFNLFLVFAMFKWTWWGRMLERDASLSDQTCNLKSTIEGW